VNFPQLTNGIQQDPTVLESDVGDIPSQPEAPTDLPDNVGAFLKALKAYQTALVD